VNDPKDFAFSSYKPMSAGCLPKKTARNINGKNHDITQQPFVTPAPATI
jgi:hypothetical protein